MPTLNTDHAALGTCPVCGGLIQPAGPLMAAEVIPCPECQSMLVVERLEGGLAGFGEAPRVEEDWGE